MPETLAIIIPVYNEEDNILPLVRQVTDAFAGQSQPYEVVFVDDASSDRTWVRIREAQRGHPNVRGVQHCVNSGQSAAFLTGLRSTQGSLVATLDGDLQNDPADLPRLLAELANADFVCGIRAKRQDNWVRLLSTRVARRARRLALGVDFQDTGCFLRVFRRSALDGVLPFNGWHRFLPILVHGAGKSVSELAVNHRPRVAGTSKYGVWNRLWRGVYDLIGVGWVQKRALRPVTLSPGETASALQARPPRPPRQERKQRSNRGSSPTAPPSTRPRPRSKPPTRSRKRGRDAA